MATIFRIGLYPNLSERKSMNDVERISNKQITCQFLYTGLPITTHNLTGEVCLWSMWSLLGLKGRAWNCILQSSLNTIKVCMDFERHTKHRCSTKCYIIWLWLCSMPVIFRCCDSFVLFFSFLTVCLCRTLVRKNLCIFCNISSLDKPRAIGTNVKNKYCLNKK